MASVRLAPRSAAARVGSQVEGLETARGGGYGDGLGLGDSRLGLGLGLGDSRLGLSRCRCWLGHLRGDGWLRLDGNRRDGNRLNCHRVNCNRLDNGSLGGRFRLGLGGRFRLWLGGRFRLWLGIRVGGQHQLALHGLRRRRWRRRFRFSV